MALRAESKELLSDYEKLKPRTALQRHTHKPYVKKLKETEDQYNKTLQNRNKQRIVHFWDSPCLMLPSHRQVYDDKNKATTDGKNIGFSDPIENKSPLKEIRGNTRFVLWLAVTYNGTTVKPRRKWRARFVGTGRPNSWMQVLDCRVRWSSHPEQSKPIVYVMGLTFVGRAFAEAALLRLAAAYELVTRARRPPQLLPTVTLPSVR